MATRPRTRRSGTFDPAAYEDGVAPFLAELEEARYGNLVGPGSASGLAGIYERHASLFQRAAVDGLQAAVQSAVADDGRARTRALLAFASGGYLARATARLSDAIAAAENQAAVRWRAETVPYHAARDRISAISDRGERNALLQAWLRVVEAINPLRSERLDALHEATRELGYADYVEMVRGTRGWNPDELAAMARGALNDSETGYYAAMRRLMARVGIEQGDGSLADAWHVLRGIGWDAWFEPRRTVPIMEGTLAGLGITLRGQPGVTLDLEPRPSTSPAAYCAIVRAPGDVRLLVNPRGGWEDVSAALHEAGHVEHFAHVAEGMPPSLAVLGDASVTEGYAELLEGLLGEPEWLGERVGMGEADQQAFVDFYALVQLHRLRMIGGQLIYEVGLHRGGEPAVHRAMYSGTLGLLAGVRVPEELFLTAVDDALYLGGYLRSLMLAGQLDESLARAYPSGWWRSGKAGTWLREQFARGLSWNAERVVASLGYDGLDWRPVLRKIRTQLIGEMSGYGGPNITTRAGTRKI